MRKVWHVLGAASVAMAALECAGHASPRKWTVVKIETEADFPPWNYTKSNGSLGGFEIDLARHLCDLMKVKCTITAQSFNGEIPALNDGKFDAIMDDLAITPQREKVIAFSIPYAALCYTFATLKGSAINKALPAEDKVIPLANKGAAGAAIAQVRAALKGKTIGTLAAGTSVTFFNTYLSGVALMRQYNTEEERDFDLKAGRVDAIIGSQDALMGSAVKEGIKNIALAGPCFQGGVVGSGSGVGLRKRDVKLKTMFDKAIREAESDGTIKKLSEHYLHIDVTPH